MKKQLAIFAGSLLLGGVLVVLYLAAEGKFWNNLQPDAAPPTAPAQPHQAETPAAEPGAQDTVQPDNQSAAADTSARTDNAPDVQSADNSAGQPMIDPLLPAKMQDALRQYPTLSEKDDRASLVMDMLGMTDNGATKPQVAEVLGMMFHEEATTDLKLDLLDDLIMVGDNNCLPTFVDGIDPNQPKEVRTKAILALENLGDSQTVPYLQELLTDPDPDIRQAAQEALDRLNPQ